MRRLLSASYGLLIVALVLLVFWKLAFTNLILARGDVFLYFYPYWDFRAQALLSGRLPLWNPYLFMGAPFLANPQAGVLYPLNWPLVFLPAPTAVKVAILLHVGLAGAGALAFARRALGLARPGAMLGATVFALGGYLTAQVEHVNQLQALAWLPWLLLAVHRALHAQPHGHRRWLRASILAGMVLALQLLAGHTQSAVISMIGTGLYAAIMELSRGGDPRQRIRCLWLPAALVVIIVAVGMLLAAAQLLPTLELSAQSLRAGGLPLREALSFSLDPRLMGRALLPGYARSLFSEFVAYLGVIGLALAALGLGRTPARLGLLGLAIVGLTFAIGVANPLYVGLASLPPLSLFRVPARWLVLFAFGGAMLAGHGLDAIERRRAWAFAIPLGLMLLSPLATDLTPAGETGPLGPPAALDVAGWLGALALLVALLYLPALQRVRAWGVVLLAAIELVGASQALPLNRLTAPEAYTSVRPAMTQLLVSLEETIPPPRFLSMSALRFDPGDLTELRGELEPQLAPDAVTDAIVATKHKEVLSPNLPLAWRIPAVDGFDGGVLPLRHYADFAQLFTGLSSPDGRLRENVSAAPDARLLSLVNARYLVTDKVDDAWVQDVFYDLQFSLELAAGETYAIAHVPPLQATALGSVQSTAAASGGGTAHITFSDGAVLALPVTSSRVSWGRPATPVSLTLEGPMALSGLSLIDERSGAFQSLTLGPYRLVHSGDVKIYDNPARLPRAFVVPTAVMLSDAAARAALRDQDFDPAATVILADEPGSRASAIGIDGQPSEGAHRGSGMVRITDYRPEHIRLTAEGPGYLLLTDAYYPGWAAWVDGRPRPILRADIMFRAVWLEPGTHTVEFRFEPVSVRAGVWISAVGWIVALGALLTLGRKPAGGEQPGIQAGA